VVPWLLGGLLAAVLLAGDVLQAQVPDGSFGRAVLAGAQECVRRAPVYDASWVALDYPGGDPGWQRGVCTDVVIRSFRRAGVDLQVLVHEDVLRRPSAYGIVRPDPSIDHRRVRNLVVYFLGHALTLLSEQHWSPGDVVVWDLRGRGVPDHVGIVSDRMAAPGRPLVFHHFPRAGPFSGRPSEDDCLHRWRILYHFRWTGEGAAR